MANEAKETVKPVVIHDADNGRDYTLEFNRDAVKFAEARGFKIEDIDNFPLTKSVEFFWYAFRMHHPNFSLKQAEDMLLDRMGGMSEALAQRLAELWLIPYAALNPATGEEKNSSVTVEL